MDLAASWMGIGSMLSEVSLKDRDKHKMQDIRIFSHMQDIRITIWGKQVPKVNGD